MNNQLKVSDILNSIKGDLGEEDIKAYIELEESVGLEPEEIITWCEERLAYFKVPRFIEFVTEFPRTITKQEIERHALRERGRGDAWDHGSGDGHVLAEKGYARQGTTLIRASVTPSVAPRRHSLKGNMEDIAEGVVKGDDDGELGEAVVECRCIF